LADPLTGASSAHRILCFRRHRHHRRSVRPRRVEPVSAGLRADHHPLCRNPGEGAPGTDAHRRAVPPDRGTPHSVPHHRRSS
ncbi:LAO/AO transporter ATPase, partial [Corchorus olitorius]